MKRKMFFAAFAIACMVGTVSAQSNNTTKDQSKARKACYVDANNNDVCDKYENGSCTVGQGKGMQDGSGKGKGQGLKDGSGKKNGQGKGKGCGANCGKGRGRS